MRTESLVTFATVAKEMSYTKAAERLFLTPSTVHQQMKSLEAELGVALLHVAGKEVLLTEAGRAFLHCSEEVQESLERFRLLTKGMQEASQSRVRIGATSFYGVLAQAADAVSAEYPGVHVEFRTLRPWQAIEQLRLGSIDFGFVGSMYLETDLVAEVCAENHIRIVVPSRHELAASGPVPFADLQRYSFVGYQSSSARRAVDEWLSTRPDLKVRYAAEIVSSLDIKATALLMNLPAFIVESAAEAELRDGTLVSLHVTDFRASYSLYAVQRPHLEQSAAAMAFREALRRNWDRRA